MNRPALACAAVCLPLVALAWSVKPPAVTGHRPPSRAVAARAPAAMPDAFIANLGQWNTDARFVGRFGDILAGFDADGVRLRATPSGSRYGVLLKMAFEGAPARLRPEGERSLRGRWNFFLGKDPARWRRDVAGFERVRFTGVRDGVDVVFRPEAGTLEYDVHLEPGADLEQLVVRVDGVTDLEVAATGGLLMHTGIGVIEQTPPVTWQVTEDGARRPVDCRFRRIDHCRYGFTTEPLDPLLELVIDPGFVVAFSTYLGGSGGDGNAFQGIAVDAAGNTIVAGNTGSVDFPTTTGVFQASLAGSSDVFVSKLDASGSSLIFSTYLGGSGEDSFLGHGLAVDGSGAIHVAGGTQSTDFPTTAGVYQTSPGGGGDAFVVRLSASGGTLSYGTYLGGAGGDSANAVAIGPAGVYVAGSAAAGFPVTSGAYDTSFNSVVGGDVFVARMNLDGLSAADLTWATYVGGALGDLPRGLAVDSSGDAHFCGVTWTQKGQTLWPTTSNALIPTLRLKPGSVPGSYFAELSAAGSELLYSTFLAKPGLEDAWGVAVDAGGIAYVTGRTFGSGFQVTADAFDSSHGGNGRSDSFVLVFDTTQSGSASLVYGTYLGGSEQDQGRSIAVDANRNIYVTGHTDEVAAGGGGGGKKGKPKPPPETFPNTESTPYAGGWDATVTVFARDEGNDTWQLAYSNLFGSSGSDEGLAITVGPFGGVHIGGSVNAAGFPTAGTPAPYDATYNGGGDGFVLKLVAQ